MTSDLITRLSKLDGPDREVDAEICILFQYGGENSEGAMNVRTDPEWDDNDLLFEINEEGCCNPLPELTASVEAVIALAERLFPNEQVRIDRIAFEGKCQWRTSLTGKHVSYSSDLVIALLITVLRAKESENGE